MRSGPLAGTKLFDPAGPTFFYCVVRSMDGRGNREALPGKRLHITNAMNTLEMMLSSTRFITRSGTIQNFEITKGTRPPNFDFGGGNLYHGNAPERFLRTGLVCLPKSLLVVQKRKFVELVKKGCLFSRALPPGLFPPLIGQLHPHIRTGHLRLLFLLNIWTNGNDTLVPMCE